MRSFFFIFVCLYRLAAQPRRNDEIALGELLKYEGTQTTRARTQFTVNHARDPCTLVNTEQARVTKAINYIYIHFLNLLLLCVKLWQWWGILYIVPNPPIIYSTYIKYAFFSVSIRPHWLMTCSLGFFLHLSAFFFLTINCHANGNPDVRVSELIIPAPEHQHTPFKSDAHLLRHAWKKRPCLDQKSRSRKMSLNKSYSSFFYECFRCFFFNLRLHLHVHRPVFASVLAINVKPCRATRPIADERDSASTKLRT